MMKNNNTKAARNNFKEIILKIASPARIKEWSYGEVLKPETINYRTGKSERGGLFDERVFGPTKSFECYCGKYKRIRYKDIICEKCGVQVTDSIVRRERMGHIELASPVSHIWYLKGTIPAPLPLFLGIQQSQLEKVIYFAGYIVKNVNEAEKQKLLKDLDAEFKDKLGNSADESTKERLRELMVTAKDEIKSLSPWQILDEATYNKYVAKYSSVFEAGIGAEAVHDILKSVDMAKFELELAERLANAGSVEREKLQKRLSLVRGMKEADIRPEWMFVKNLPVIPPGLRPMVALEGGRHATSDVNDLYRRVINRNNRLKKLMGIGAPDVILRNEKRILQEAVDSLFDNSARGAKEMAMNATQRRQLKSLADNLQGKQGMLRQNLLGKRVDYSARSVIVVGPRLNLNQCGLPKHMALELFKPFIISKLLGRELAFNIKSANKLIEEGDAVVWAILEEVIEGKYVLLNRAPTLHRLGMQAFLVKLIEGNAIQLHPLVCTAFNADFDGDQMAVHLPLGEEAQLEAKEIMAAQKNILKPGDGVPTFFGKLLDIVLGVYWMTTLIETEKPQYFSSPNEAILAHENGVVSFRSKIIVLPTSSPRYAAFHGKIFETTVGRLLFNSVLPNDYGFVNQTLDKKSISKLLEDVIDRYGINDSWVIFDRVKNFAFEYATKSGVTFGLFDVEIPVEKKALVEEANKLVAEVEANYGEGFLSSDERYKKIVEIWSGTKTRIEKSLPNAFKQGNPIFDMVGSGARGNYGQLNQMAGMKGLIQNNTGRTLDFPIISSYKEGLSPIEYFVTSYGARKGGSDTALKTAQAGYFTRKLVDVAQDTIVVEEDCGSTSFKDVYTQNLGGIEIPLWKSVWGRVLAKDVTDPATGKVIFEKGILLKQFEAKEIEKAGVKVVSIRTPLTCITERGLCQKCYGLDMGRGHLVRLGEAVGIVAAQAIGEPGTQLTMRTFHSGGVAEVDITQGLPRVTELFEKRMPKTQVPATIASYDGEIAEIGTDGKNKIITLVLDEHESMKSKAKSLQYEVSPKRVIVVKVGDKVKRGDLLTDGSADIDELFKVAGSVVAQDYIAEEVTKVYELQGASISRKHLDIIVKQMFARVQITEAGDTKYSVGDIIPDYTFAKENTKMRAQGLQEAKSQKIVQGITQASLSTESWLSAASFQNTTKILIKAATRGQVDELVGLKENVIAGRLVPIGTGFRTKEEIIADEKASKAKDEAEKKAKENLE